MKRNQNGFTLIELLVVIAIIAILAAILFPIFARAREAARATSCKSNLQQIGKGMMQYTQEYDEFAPRSFQYYRSGGDLVWWPDLLRPFVKSETVYLCPSVPSTRRPSHMCTAWLRPAGYLPAQVCMDYTVPDWIANNGATGVALAQVEDPAGTVFALDSKEIEYWSMDHSDQYPTTQGNGYHWTDERHNETKNVLYYDGHVKANKKLRLGEWSLVGND